MWLDAVLLLPPCCFNGDGAWPRARKKAVRVDGDVVGSYEVRVLERRICGFSGIWARRPWSGLTPVLSTN